MTAALHSENFMRIGSEYYIAGHALPCGHISRLFQAIFFITPSKC